MNFQSFLAANAAVAAIALTGCGGGSDANGPPLAGVPMPSHRADSITRSMTQAQYNQQACVTADASCKESFAVGQHNFSTFRSYPLHTANANITQAVIVTHGLQRNAPDYFAAVTAALGNVQDPTLLVIAPHFKGAVRNSATCNDPLEPGELHWSCTGQGSVNRWDDGGAARDTGTDVIHSFDIIDRLIDALSDPDVFPNLAKITVTGHSDGGQFTQRYAAGNQIDGAINASVKYVIANPGSYLYLDNRRLPKGETCFNSGSCTAAFTADWDADLACAATYNNFKYGLDNRTYGYMHSDQPGFSDDELRTRFLSRNVALLSGENDQTSASQFDTSCQANAQGIHLAGDGTGLIGGRRERSIIFWNYLQQLGATHTLTMVPMCGHDESCMYSARETIQEILF